MRTLYVWSNDYCIGVFSENDDGDIDFKYMDSDPLVPVSLSLFPGEHWSRRAPRNFLTGLLPSGTRRFSMAYALRADPDDLFSLLAGADSEGGLVFTLSDQLPSYDEPAQFVDDDGIALEIRSLMQNSMDRSQIADHMRFSLNGNQSKFTLEYAPTPDESDPNWIWPSAAYPSTHIFKPPVRDRDRQDIPEVESASSRLAYLAGMNVPRSGIMHFRDTEAFVIERYDRRMNVDGTVTRLHAEDLLQALGLPPADKYHISAAKILSLLENVDPTLDLSYQWITQLAFNISIDNVDAHAQNYSILITPDSIKLAPMYDLLTTAYWPDVSKTLAMSIGGINGAAGVSPESWRNLAKHNGLDPDRVEKIARQVAGNVLAAAPEAYKDLSPRIKDRALSIIQQENQRIEPISPLNIQLTRQVHKHHGLRK